MTGDTPLPPRAWLTVGLLWWVACFNYLARVMITTMHGSIVGAIPMTEAQFGLLTSSFLWIYGLLNPVAGFLSDRFSRGRVIAFSMLIWSALTWLTGCARNFEQLLIMRLLMGAAEACYFPAALALISEYHRGATRSRATGLHMSGLLFGASLAGFGGWLAEVRSWNFAFSLVGGMGVLYSFVLLATLRDAPAQPASGQTAEGGRRPPGDGEGLGSGHSRRPEVDGHLETPIRLGAALASLLRSPGFLLVFAFSAVAGAIGYSVLGWMPTYLLERFHLHQGEAGFSATVYLNVAEVGGIVAGGIWADRWSRTRADARRYVLALGYCGAAPGVFLTAHSGVLGLAILGLVFWGLASGFCDSNLMPTLCLVSDDRYRATSYGLSNLAATVAGGLGIYAVGLLRDRGFDFGRMLGWSAFFLLACPVLLFAIKPKKAPG